ncbi:MAG: hypothetical protein QNJ63_23735 [Calothrix sp. MO_192.B10]|nr:hypothetical protein [Calothrix sp. MO_192.B10]
MGIKMILTLAIAFGIGGLTNQAQAQSPVAPNTNIGQYVLSGDSLSDINNRNAENDFSNFFLSDKSDSVIDGKVEENTDSNADEGGIRFRKVEESLSQTDTPIILQPAESFNGNDGVQVELDLGR